MTARDSVLYCIDTPLRRITPHKELLGKAVSCMIQTLWYTNLELDGEIWPKELPARPQVGDIVFSVKNYGTPSRPKNLRLEIVRVSWIPDRNNPDEYIARCELAKPTLADTSDENFYEMYDRMRSIQPAYSG